MSTTGTTRERARKTDHNENSQAQTTIAPPRTPTRKNISPVSISKGYNPSTDIKPPKHRSYSLSRGYPPLQSTSNGSNHDATNPNSRQLSRVNCTHINMDRVYVNALENQKCDMCGNTPSLGWLYFCRQDHIQEKQSDNNQHETETPPLSRSVEITSTPSSDRRPPTVEPLTPKESFLNAVPTEMDLKTLGFHPSILKQASLGMYTPNQLSILKSQKLRVIAAIESHQNLSRRLEEQLELESKFPNVTLRKRKNSKGLKQQQVQVQMQSSRCALKACHACRPYYKDRTFWSINAIVEDTQLVLLRLDSCFLGNGKVTDAAIVRQLGLRKILSISKNFMNDSGPSIENDAQILIPTDDDGSINELNRILDSSSTAMHPTKLDGTVNKEVEKTEKCRQNLFSRLRRMGKTSLDSKERPARTFNMRSDDDHGYCDVVPANEAVFMKSKRVELTPRVGEIVVEELVEDLVTQA